MNLNLAEVTGGGRYPLHFSAAEKVVAALHDPNKTTMLLVVVQELVVQDRGCHPRTLTAILGIFGTDDPPLAEHVAVLLAGNLLGHLKNHFYQDVDRQGRRSP